jgi:uncharacterized protein (DUF427 family)
MRYPGGLIASTPVTANYPSGVWTQAQAAPYQAQNVWTRDQYWPYTTLLLQGNGTNGAQNNTFLDSSTNNFTITRNGNTTQGSFTPYEANGYWSNYFDGTGDYLQLASNSAFNMNTYCCLEAWVCYTSLTSQTLIVGRDGSYWLGYDFTSIGGTATKFVFTINNGSWVGVSSTTSPVVGVWYHVVGIKDNTTLRIYINGVQENTATFSGTAVTPANVMGIGANQNTQNMAGYISNARLVLGASASVLPYTANFSPVTTPLTAVSGTSLLTCQSNRFLDNSTNAFTITRNGDTSVQAFQPFPGATTWSGSVLGGSGYWDGAGDALSLPSSTNLAMETGDFTIEMWVNGANNGTTVGGSFRRLFTLGTVQTSGCIETYNGSGTMYIEIFGVTALTFDASILLNSAWNHFAITRSGTTLRAFVNGTQVASATNSTNLNAASSSTSFIGAANASAGNFIGYISDVRILKGTAQYTSTFTPPTAPLTAITNTQLLTRFTNAGIFDSATMNNLETVGNAQVSTSVVKYGTGSMYFNNTQSGSPTTTDYLLASNNPQYNLGGGNFTVEFWLYPTTVSVSNPYNQAFIISKASYSSNQGWSIIQGNQTIILRIGDSGGTFTSSNALSANTWQHIAVVRNGTAVNIYVNGTSVASGTLNNFTDSSTVLNVGGAKSTTGWNGDYPYNGYIDDLRITKGAARYIGNFTPPVARMPQQ